MSQISLLMLFSSEKKIFSWTYLLKKTPRNIKILIFPVWNKILKTWDTLFEIIQTEISCSKIYFNFLLTRKAGASRNNIEKEPQKPWPKLKKYILNIYWEGQHNTLISKNIYIYKNEWISLNEKKNWKWLSSNSLKVNEIRNSQLLRWC